MLDRSRVLSQSSIVHAALVNQRKVMFTKRGIVSFRNLSPVLILRRRRHSGFASRSVAVCLHYKPFLLRNTDPANTYPDDIELS